MYLINTIQQILNLLRIKNIFIATTCVFLSAYILGADDFNKIFICVVIISSIIGFGNILNDIIDLKNDSYNHPNRILPQQIISIKKVYFLLFACLVIILVSSFYISMIAKTYLLVANIVLLFYNLYYKNMFLIGNVVIAMLLSSVFIFTELVLVQSYTQLIIPSVLAFGLSLIREILKDLEDMDGDNKVGRKTMPIYLGIQATLIFIYILIVSFLVLCLYIYYYYYYTDIFLYSVIILVEIPLIISLFLLINNPNKKTFSNISTLIKYIIVCGILILLFANKG